MLELSASSALVAIDSLRIEGAIALAGPSGAGKTTLLRIAAGLARPAAGRIACDGETWLDTDDGIDLPPEKRRCALLFQDHALFPHMTAVRNVEYGARGDKAKAMNLLERLGLAARADARPHELSGGERQRVALARALAAKPRALLLDEPLASLDPRTRASASRELVEVLAELGVPAVVVTHDFAEAALLGREVVVLDGGRVAQRGTPSELASSPASAFVADFTGAVVLTGTARPGPSGLTVVALDGGGTAESTDEARGRVAVSVHPWDITIDGAGSAHNRVRGAITTLTRLGNRTRVGLGELVAEITTDSVERLGLTVGAEVDAVWKAAATRLLPL